MKFIFITNNVTEAKIAQSAGVDQIMVDLEVNGKLARQGHLDTVVSSHDFDDISSLRGVLDTSELLVRVNPAFPGSQTEIDQCISRGADNLMLPMFATSTEVAEFISNVDGRARTTLLLETSQALARLDRIIELPGVHCIHLGLNDLHLAMKLKFMFELFSGGLVEYFADKMRSNKIPFGVGGVARLGEGILPADMILSEHVRLGSGQVILSRDFRKIFEKFGTGRTSEEMFTAEVHKLRRFLKERNAASKSSFEEVRAEMNATISRIVHART